MGERLVEAGRFAFREQIHPTQAGPAEQLADERPADSFAARVSGDDEEPQVCDHSSVAEQLGSVDHPPAILGDERQDPGSREGGLDRIRRPGGPTFRFAQARDAVGVAMLERQDRRHVPKVRTHG